MTSKKLLLFDIDGTILTSGGAGVRALRLGFHRHFGIQDDLSNIDMAGRTDSGIAREILATHQLPQSIENITALLDAYLHHLAIEIPQTAGQLLPGIIPLLTLLHQRTDIVLALLTGNLARGAEIKLRHYGLWHYFEFGAFADDHHDRNQLGHFAKTRAHQKHGHEFPPQSIFILGDTPHDITCARAIGAKAIAIATGKFTRAELSVHQPDFLFDDLTDIDAVLAAIN